jgi:stage V sporulation protein AD
VGGKKEGEGPLAAGFDELARDNTFGQTTWEAAERELAARAARYCLQKAQAEPGSVNLALAGDLQAQCTASGYAMRELGLPFAGLYGACSTMAEALGLAAALCAGGMADGILAMSSSHFCASERQFRTPLSYGAVRTPTSQWTATAAGCCLVRPAGYAARGAGKANIMIRAVTFGRVRDLQVKDINNMGAAMAPAAAATLAHYLRDTHASAQDFDTIYTGDLGRVGSTLLAGLLADEGIELPNHEDCGLLLYNAEKQQVHSGGSGAGCCAGVLCSHILPALAARQKQRVLFVATGALMSQTTFLQRESIPTVAHLVELAAE